MHQFSFNPSNPITPALHTQGIGDSRGRITTRPQKTPRNDLNGLRGLCDVWVLLCMGSTIKRLYGRFSAFGGAA